MSLCPRPGAGRGYGWVAGHERWLSQRNRPPSSSQVERQSRKVKSKDKVWRASLTSSFLFIFLLRLFQVRTTMAADGPGGPGAPRTGGCRPSCRFSICPCAEPFGHELRAEWRPGHLAYPGQSSTVLVARTRPPNAQSRSTITVDDYGRRWRRALSGSGGHASGLCLRS